MKPPAAMMRSKALRSTIRSLITGKALGAPRLDGDRLAVLEAAHVQLAGGGGALGAVGQPLMTRLHVPQMPSRQSWSKTMGSSPFSMRPSFTTSSISRNDISVLMSVAPRSPTNWPRGLGVLLAPDVQVLRFDGCCRSHDAHVHLLVAAGRRWTFSNASGSMCRLGVAVRRCIPRRRRGRSSRRRAAPRRPGSGTPRGSGRRRIRGVPGRPGTSVRPVRGSRPRARPFSSAWFDLVAVAGHPDVLPELLREGRDLLEGLLQAWLRCGPCRSSPT